MYAWEAIQKTLDYIEDNIHSKLDMDTLAGEAALSLFYYQRLFSRLVKHPVREYIRLRRLARACEALCDNQNRILDVALDFGFGCHETFTRAFREAYGMTPEQYRESPVTLVSVNKPNLLLNYVLIDEGVPLISEDIVLEINRKTLESPLLFIGVADIIPVQGHMPAGENTGVDLLGQTWDKYHRVKHDIPRKSGGRELDVSYQGNAPEGYFTFFAGGEVESEMEDDRFSAWRFPAGEYVVCEFEAEDFTHLVTDAIYKAWNFTIGWLDKHDLKMNPNAASPEMYYDSSPEGSRMELWIAACKK